MKISQQGIDINRRFFEALATLAQMKVIRGLQTFTREYGINRWNLITARNKPDISVIKQEWLSYLVLGYGVSADWLLTGRGEMFKQR